MANILGVGIATLDIINETEVYPEEDSELRACAQHLRRGGNVSNTLTVLSQLKQSCYFMGSLADDSNSRFIQQSLDQYHINYRPCPVIANSRTPTSYITLNRRNGSRTIVHYRDLPELDFAQYQQLDPTEFDWIHFEARNIEQTRRMIEHTRTHNPGATLSIELEKNREQLEQLFNLADIYFISRAYAASLNCHQPDTILSELHKKNPQAILVAPWGRHGAYALQAKQQQHSPAYPPETIIDTIGAGDTFIAGFIHQYQQTHNVTLALDFANRLAGHKCGKPGFELQLETTDLLEAAGEGH